VTDEGVNAEGLPRAMIVIMRVAGAASSAEVWITGVNF
jgi:hypothetical protein